MGEVTALLENIQRNFEVYREEVGYTRKEIGDRSLVTIYPVDEETAEFERLSEELKMSYLRDGKLSQEDVERLREIDERVGSLLM